MKTVTVTYINNIDMGRQPDSDYSDEQAARRKKSCAQSYVVQGPSQKEVFDNFKGTITLCLKDSDPDISNVVFASHVDRQLAKAKATAFDIEVSNYPDKAYFTVFYISTKEGYLETDSEQERYFKLIYKALRPNEHIRTDSQAAAIASMRLIMISRFGEEHQRELIQEWNDEAGF